MTVLYRNALVSQPKPGDALTFEIAGWWNVGFSPEGMTFTLLESDPPVAGKSRTEFVLKPGGSGSFALGQEMWFAFDIWIPFDFKDGPGSIYIAQIHDAPADGNWSKHPSRPPVFGIRYAKGHWQAFYGASKTQQKGEPIAFKRGAWNRIVFGFFGSLGSDGWGVVRVGRIEQRFDGANAFKGAGPSFGKGGCYAPNGVDGQMVLRVRRVALGTKRSDVLIWKAA